jgi:hypothetical protein
MLSPLRGKVNFNSFRLEIARSLAFGEAARDNRSII